ncbi:hypothetical protein CYY_005278 [Polysphondylium violaceum]|uniref:BD-FAE-like domain-containing protein n=1 Tax=Polysphondylium violaceum TaxID=133409 RepID=A0A8J4PVA9_9MYCE|nr:hypothetical protein CYY_005278 [Polysphondylium violaceum]
METQVREMLDLSYQDTSLGNNYYKLDLYLPAAVNSDKLPPLMVYVHGGLWMDRDKRDSKDIGFYFSDNGFAVAIVNYTLTKHSDNPVHHYPVHNRDLSKSLYWLLTNDSVNGLFDRENVHLIGHSCGAHMIALACMQWDQTMNGLSMDGIKSVVGLQGIYDVERFVNDFPNWTSEIGFIYNNSDPKSWESPQHIDPQSTTQTIRDAISNKIDWLLVHSPEDLWVNREQSIYFKQQMLTLWSCKKVIVDEDLHGAHFPVVETLTVKSDPTGDKLRNSLNQFYSKYF